MRALIDVGYGCNNRCTFCHTPDRRDVAADAAAVERRIDRAAALGHAMVVLSGGEPTARPEVFRWAARVAARGMDLGLVTNGRMLAYPAVVDRLLACRLRYVAVALHGGTAAVHDAITRADAFAQTLAAVRNLAGRGLELVVHAVVTRTNVDHLPALVDALLPFPDATLRFSLARWGGAEPVVPALGHAAGRVRAAIAHGRAAVRAHGAGRPGGPAFTHDGFPLCLLPGDEGRHDDLRSRGVSMVAAPGAPDFAPLDAAARVHPAPCAGCAHRGRCPGLDGASGSLAADAGALVPVTGQPRSNSFNYVFEAHTPPVTAETPEGCPVRRDGEAPWDRGRVVFVRRGAAVARYRATARDFADREIAAIKHGLGQVYLDVSDKPSPDDFARDLVQLQRSALCVRCPAYGTCAGLWEPAAADPFTRDDAHVRAVVAHLRGDVLDVGCGEGPYGDLLAELAARGAITYTGLDPDPARVAGLRARWPWARVEVGEAEALDPAVRADHVLVLRSWNHLRDTARAASALAAAVRPGGSLTVADNVAFGLVRTRRQAARAESGPAAFEHYRTDGAAEAAAALAATGLALVERRDVGPATSNQWLLRYRRP